MPSVPLTVLDWDRLFKHFEAPVMKFDCGTMCAPLNGGQPVCCTTENAVPVMNTEEFRLLTGRTDLWHRFEPKDAHERELVAELDESIVACECKGAAFCERDNRSLSCRTFPFFPYVTREWEFLGLSHYWQFEDRCWVLSNLRKVEPEYVRQFMDVYDVLFAHDHDELSTMRDWSATMRRVFSRWDRPIPVITREGEWVQVLPHGEGIGRAGKKTFKKRGAYRSEKAYRRAVREAQKEYGR